MICICDDLKLFKEFVFFLQPSIQNSKFITSFIACIKKIDRYEREQAQLCEIFEFIFISRCIKWKLIYMQQYDLFRNEKFMSSTCNL